MKKTKEDILKEYRKYYEWSISDCLMKFYFLWFLSILILGLPALSSLFFLLDCCLTPVNSFLEIFYKIFDSIGGNLIATWWIFSVIIIPLAWSIAEDSLAKKFLRKNLAYKEIVTTDEISRYNFNATFS
jgi:hypothetical protein